MTSMRVKSQGRLLRKPFGDLRKQSGDLRKPFGDLSNLETLESNLEIMQSSRQGVADRSRTEATTSTLFYLCTKQSTPLPHQRHSQGADLHQPNWATLLIKLGRPNYLTEESIQKLHRVIWHQAARHVQPSSEYSELFDDCVLQNNRVGRGPMGHYGTIRQAVRDCIV